MCVTGVCMSTCISNSPSVFPQGLPSQWTPLKQLPQSSPPWPEPYRNTCVWPASSPATPWRPCSATWPAASPTTWALGRLSRSTSPRAPSCAGTNRKWRAQSAGCWCVSSCWHESWTTGWYSRWRRDPSPCYVLSQKFPTSVSLRRWCIPSPTNLSSD